MPCTNCDSDFSNIQMPCKVCELIDKDVTEKMVWYCDTCKAYICKPCLRDGVRRAKAAVISKALWLKDKTVKLFKDLVS